VKQIRDKAQAIQHFLRQQGASLEVQNTAAELTLRAERKLGEILKETVAHGGERKSKSRARTLKTIPEGISRDQSSCWQTIAELPEAV